MIKLARVLRGLGDDRASGRFYRGNITNKHDRGSIIKTKPRR